MKNLNEIHIAIIAVFGSFIGLCLILLFSDFITTSNKVQMTPINPEHYVRICIEGHLYASFNELHICDSGPITPIFKNGKPIECGND